jgi:hypothetical protein
MGPEGLITYIPGHFSRSPEAQKKERRGFEARN